MSRLAGAITGSCVAATLALIAAPLSAQADRYELGKRFIALEKIAATKSDPAERASIAPEIDRALQSFFSMNMRTACRAIDAARLKLEHGESVPADIRWATSLSVSSEAALVDADAESIEFTVDSLYDAEVSVPEGVIVRIRCGEHRFEAEVESLPLALTLKTPPPGDHKVHWEIVQGERVLTQRVRTQSVAENLRARIDAVRTKANALEPVGEPDIRTEIASARALANRCRALTRPRAPETDFPAARLLTDAEALVEAAGRGRRYFDQRRPGEHWVRFLAGDRKVSCRVLVPKLDHESEAPPLVIAMHGAGGSENLFFDGESGLTPELCAKRGWLLVATRSTPVRPPPLDALLDELGTRYRFDPRRVFVVGHSMGAMQAVGEASRRPSRFSAIAALGGGGRIRRSQGFEKLALFVGVGDRDFLAGGARQLRRAATDAGADVTWREYQDVGHVLILQDALRDVFAFFDRRADRDD